MQVIVSSAWHCVHALKLCHTATLHLAQGYHLLAAALFAPALVLQPALLALALGVALALMVAAEVVRLGAIPIVSASHRPLET